MLGLFDKGFEEDERSFGTDLVWIPPCRSQLEKEGDYEESLGTSYPKIHKSRLAKRLISKKLNKSSSLNRQKTIAKIIKIIKF